MLDVCSCEFCVVVLILVVWDGSCVLLLILVFVVLVLVIYLCWGVFNWFWGVYLVMSMVIFIVYVLDKCVVVCGGWWVVEGMLYWLLLVCGWFGVLLV